MIDATFPLAFIAGLVSFLSPCVLPLVPAYIGYMGGRLTYTVAAQTGGTAVVTRPGLNARFSTVLHSLAFVLGFTLVFVAIGLLSTAFVSAIGRQNISALTNVISRAGGLLIIFFGLHFMGVIGALFNRLLQRPSLLNTPLIALGLTIAAGLAAMWIFEDWLPAVPVVALLLLWFVLSGAFTAPQTFWTNAIGRAQNTLYADTRRQMVAQGHQSYLGSLVMGVVFSAGWTPCIGPIYGTILTMAAAGAEIERAGVLLAAYSLGLGIPFILTAFLLDGAQGILRRLQKHIRTIELVAGVFLVVIGIAVASGNLQDLSADFAVRFGDFSYRLEECVTQVYDGTITLGDFGTCMSEVGTAVEPA